MHQQAQAKAQVHLRGFVLVELQPGKAQQAGYYNNANVKLRHIKPEQPRNGNEHAQQPANAHHVGADLEPEVDNGREQYSQPRSCNRYFNHVPDVYIEHQVKQPEIKHRGHDVRKGTVLLAAQAQRRDALKAVKNKDVEGWEQK